VQVEEEVLLEVLVELAEVVTLQLIPAVVALLLQILVVVEVQVVLLEVKL
jgi:hypothetical protein|tara:strand:- start:121 stop:270 length:150 start_codon:yes stop_codon:yes gene_type:complete